MSNRNRNKNGRNLNQTGTFFDYNLLFITLFMVCFGMVILYSASSYEASMEFGDSKYYLMRQLVFVIFGLISMVVCAIIDYRFYKIPFIAEGIYLVSALMVFMVKTPLGRTANGASRWIGIGGASFQVCEAVKIAVIIIMAYLINKYARSLRKLRVFLICIAAEALLAALVLVLTKDLSSTIIILGIGIIMLLVACPRFIYFVGIGLLGVLVFVGMILAEPYRLERVKVWLNPEKYSDEGGFQVLQSLYSLGSGGLFGKGLGNGIQKLGYVPEAQNDMIFTVICEELGVVGGIAVIAMFIFMIWRFMIISNNAPDLFGSMLVVGVMSHVAVQALMNIAVVTNSMPNTGVTLPFMSYGGTSIFCLLIEIGMVLSVSKRIKYEQ